MAIKNSKLAIISFGLFLPGGFACEKISNDESHKTEMTETESSSTDRAEKKFYYTCSMHPQIREDGPGKCPICLMNLTKVVLDEAQISRESDDDHAHDHNDMSGSANSASANSSLSNSAQPGEVMASLKLKKSQIDHFRPEFFQVSPMKLTKKIRMLGNVLEAQQSESSIPARFPLRIEKVFVESTGSRISKNDPVAVVYSPELITAGEEFILAKKASTTHKADEFSEMVSQSEARLSQWGIEPFQYVGWYEKGSVPDAITIYSKASGVVTKRIAVPGKYFTEGQNLFELSDLTKVWVEMDVYEHDVSHVALGQKVSLKFTALPAFPITGIIDFISPVLDSKSRTLKIRTTVENKDGQLMPGMVAEAELLVEYDTLSLVVPRSAIIDTGTRKIAWIKSSESESSYRSVVVSTGIESDGYVAILDGLSEGDAVVVEGNFLLDAQAQLFGGYEDFNARAVKE